MCQEALLQTCEQTPTTLNRISTTHIIKVDHFIGFDAGEQ